MDRNFAAQVVEVTAGEGAFVEYLPDPVIPFRGSRFYQHIQASVEQSATLVLGEVLLPGRVARGEEHAYERFHSEVEVSRPDGTLLFADRTTLAPPDGSPRSPGRLGPGGVLASLYVVSADPSPRALAGRLRAVVHAERSVLGGVSELPNGAGVVLRMLGEHSLEVQAAFRRAWNRARLVVAGAPAPSLRKGG